MALTRWAPWQGLYEMQRETDALWRRLFGSTDWHTPAFTRGWVPAVDVFHRDGDLVIRAELPGIDPEQDVEITLQQNVLTIRGERRQEEQQNGHRYESRYGRFERSVLLPDGVTEDAISAGYENGILEITVTGVAEMTGAKKIPVNAGSGRKALTTRGRKS